MSALNELLKCFFPASSSLTGETRLAGITARLATDVGAGHWTRSAAVSHQSSRTTGVGAALIRTGLWRGTGRKDLITVFHS